MPCYSGAKVITIFEVFNTTMKPSTFKIKSMTTGLFVEPQEAEGSLRFHNSTILGKVGHNIRPSYWKFCL